MNLINFRSRGGAFRILLASLVLCTACEPRVNSRGNLVLAEKLGIFKVGCTTADDVYQACGSPNLQRGDKIWIYIGARSEEISFRKVEVKNKLVVRFIFDDRGILRKIEKVSPGHAAKVSGEADSDVTELLKK